MPRFRKKPVEIEAWQYDGDPSERGVCQCEVGGGLPNPHLHTMHEGQTVVLEIGDWIIPEPVPGRYYPCKPDVFDRTYDPA